MKKIALAISASMLFLFGCIEPNKIVLQGSSEWVVYGLMGENEAPIIFIYGVLINGSQLTYHYDAKISITDQSTNQQILLQPFINENLEHIGSNEFPFGEDEMGNVVFYSSNQFRPIQGTRYTIEFDLGAEQGVTEIELPTSTPFSNVELNTNNNGVARLLMSIEDGEGEDYYKWEVGLDQVLELQLPFLDTVSGDTILNNILQPIVGTFLTSNYISQEKIQEENNVFRFNLSANLVDYPNNDESYNLNVRLRHYGKEVVDYFESTKEQNNGSLYDPFIEPVFIKSNIEGVIGLLGSYSYSEPLFIEYQP